MRSQVIHWLVGWGVEEGKGAHRKLSIVDF